MKDDCIHREAAIDMVKRCFQPEHRNKEVALQMCVDGLSGLPTTSVYPDSPCDLCRFSPPSSFDGKPCSMCPAEGKVKE